MAGRKSRDKGARGEREAVRLLREVFPTVRRRCAGEESQGNRGRDLEGVPGWCIQVQMAGRISAVAKLIEAEGAREPDEIPCAITRRCRLGHSGPWTVTLLLEDWLDLIKTAPLDQHPSLSNLGHVGRAGRPSDG